MRPHRLLAVSVLLSVLIGCASNPEPAGSRHNAFHMKLEPVPEAPGIHALTLTGGPGSFWEDLHADKELPSPVAELTLRIVDEETDAPSPHAIIGHYQLEDRRLLFVPEFPLSPSARYHAEFYSRRQTKDSHSSIRISRSIFPPQRAKAEPPVVLGIYPSAEVLPENQLKFYVLFSKPMQQGGIFKRLKLLDRTSGQETPEPFRKVELWSPDAKRLTLWLHPGRQKTGVNLNQDIGPVLRSGHRYELVIAREWESADGTPLGQDVIQEFLAGSPLKQRVDEKSWTVQPPVAGTREPLRIVFPNPMDWALLQNCLTVHAPDSRVLDGSIAIESGETVWRFTPAKNWNPGTHRIVVETRLEDLAGNNLKQPFEVDINDRPEPTSDKVAIPFNARSN